MKKIVLIILITSCFAFNMSHAQEKGSKIPSIEVKTLDRKTINFQEIRNEKKPIIISFWATWCKPCIKELTNIAEVYEDWQDETGVKLVAVSIDDTRSMNKVSPFVNASDWEYDILLDPNRDLARALGVTSVPHTFLLDGSRRIVWDHKGYVEGDEDELFEKVKKLID